MSNQANSNIRIEVLACGRESWIANVQIGNALVRATRVHSNPEGARRSADRWLAKYLETGSWTEATDWHDANYWGSTS